MRIAINGMGRIGRCVTRLLRDAQGLDLVAINDPGDHDQLIHLLRFDSTHGVIDGVNFEDGVLRFGRQTVQLLSEREPSALPWAELDIDLVIDCSGRFTRRESALGHCEAGAKQVLVSAPCADAELTVVFGVNHHLIKGDEKVISAASCTTNCLAPVIAAVDEHYGITGGVMTTIHAVTNDQRLLDLPHPKDRRRARSALTNIIPTSTGAARALALVFPDSNWAIDGLSVRVPVIDVSLVDLAVRTEKSPGVEDVNALFKDLASRRAFDGALAVSAEERVSSDFLGHPASSVVDLPLTAVASDGLLRIVSWYDNEWGFSNRVIDLARHLKGLESA
jgi:glyceraldehyde 3-phosphate dehydrogenase